MKRNRLSRAASFAVSAFMAGVIGHASAASFLQQIDAESPLDISRTASSGSMLDLSVPEHVLALDSSQDGDEHETRDDEAGARSPQGITTADKGVARTGVVRVPSLPALFSLALSNDADLQSQRLQAEATGKEVPKALAGLLPQLDLSYSYSYTDTENIYTEGGTSSCETRTLALNPDLEQRCRGYSVDNVRQVQLSQPLFSVERWRRMSKAREQRDAAQLQIEVAERDLALNTSEAYMNAFFASQKSQLLEGKRASLELQVKQASRSYELGIGDKIDLLAARASLDKSRADLAVARNQLSDALSVLERLTGTTPDFSDFSLYELADVNLSIQQVKLEQLEERIDDNPKVRLAKQQLQVARADASVSQSGYYPEISLNLSYSDRNSDDPYRASEDKSAAVQARMNLYQGGYTSASIAQADLRQQAQQSDVSNEERLALQELRTRHRGIAGDLSQLQALQQSIRSGELYLEAADKGASLGLRDMVDVLDARADLYDQRIQYADAFRQLVLDRLNMRAAIGALSTEDMTDAMSLIGRIIGPVQKDPSVLPGATHLETARPEQTKAQISRRDASQRDSLV